MNFDQPELKSPTIPEEMLADTIARNVTVAVEETTQNLARRVEDEVGKGITNDFAKNEGKIMNDFAKNEGKITNGFGKNQRNPTESMNDSKGQSDSGTWDLRSIRKLHGSASPQPPPLSIGESAQTRRMTLRHHNHPTFVVGQPDTTQPQPQRGHSNDNMFNTCREYDHMMTVEFKLVFLKINDIDTLSQQFEAEVYVQAKWQEPAFNGVSPKELDNLLPGDLWDPHLIVLNVAGEFDQERRSYVVRYEEGYESPVVLHRWRFKGLFRKRLELRHFPFDVQDLTIQLSTERSFEEIKMTHDTHQLSSVNTRTFQDSQEWTIYNHVQCDYRNTTVEYASSTIHPIIVFSCRVRRRVGYFIWNIVFIVFLVLVLSLLSVSVDPTTSDRLASTMTLFLTMVAFKLVVKQSLPTISYLTYLDIYVLGSLMYLVLYAMENSSMNSLGRWMDHDLVEAYDEFFCMFLAAILILFHLAFIVHIQVTALKRHREMSENDKRYALQARALAQKHGHKKAPNRNAFKSMK